MPPYSSFDCVANDSSSSMLSTTYTKDAAPASPQQHVVKSVRFAEETCVKEVTHLNDMDDDLRRDLWLDCEELHAIRSEACDIILAVQGDLSLAQQHGICTRGLEKNVAGYVEHIMCIRRQLYDTVDAIQQFQHSTGLLADDLLAEQLSQISIHAQTDALALAEFDRLEASEEQEC